VLRAWNLSKGGIYVVSRDIVLIKEYLAAQNEYYEEDQFNQNFTLLDTFDVNMVFIKNIKLIFKSFKLFPKAIWPVRFSTKFVGKIQSYSNPDEVYYVMARIYSLACGEIRTAKNGGSVRPIQTRVIPMNRFFWVKLLRERNLLVHVGV
jgi:hypothetical protein